MAECGGRGIHVQKLQFETKVLNLQTVGQFRGTVSFGLRKVEEFRWSHHLTGRELPVLQS